MAYTTIKKPSDYFNTKLYTGNGSANHSITGVGFQPDLVWTKKRSAAGTHSLFDVVRGVEKRIRTDSNASEDTSSDYLSSFNADGFTVNSDGGVNQNATTLASWNWKANGTGSANTAGSINSTVSANTTSGFSIVSYTGTDSGQSNVTIGHGLGAVPKVILFKQLDTGNWIVYHHTIGKDKYLVLDTTAAEANATGICNPTSTNIVLETSYGGTNSTNGMIAYCFAEKQGYSKFGSYTGNGNANGPFIYTGFKPAFVITKGTGNSGGWEMHDNKRSPFNSSKERLFAHSNNEEVIEDPYVDLLSNGFKIKTGDGNINVATTYIYMAFAEQPLVGDNPATAR